jgi:hypothetical protein
MLVLNLSGQEDLYRIAALAFLQRFRRVDVRRRGQELSNQSILSNSRWNSWYWQIFVKTVRGPEELGTNYRLVQENNRFQFRQHNGELFDRVYPKLPESDRVS